MTLANFPSDWIEISQEIEKLLLEDMQLDRHIQRMWLQKPFCFRKPGYNKKLLGLHLQFCSAILMKFLILLTGQLHFAEKDSSPEGKICQLSHKSLSVSTYKSKTVPQEIRFILSSCWRKENNTTEKKPFPGFIVHCFLSGTSYGYNQEVTSYLYYR